MTPFALRDPFPDFNENLKVCEDVFRVLSGQSGYIENL
jgi:hypothetical protein